LFNVSVIFFNNSPMFLFFGSYLIYVNAITACCPFVVMLANVGGTSQ